MNVSQLPRGLTIHPVTNNQEKKMLCLFLIWNSVIKELLMGSSLTSKVYLLSLSIFLINFAKADLNFDIFWREAITFDDPLQWAIDFFPLCLAASIILIFVGSIILTPLFIFFIDEPRTAWLVKDNRKLVAYVNIVDCCHTFTVLSRIYIIPSYRRKGIGSTLIKHFLQLNAVPMYVFFWHPDTLGFYTRLGFKRTKGSKQTNDTGNPEAISGLLVLRP